MYVIVLLKILAIPLIFFAVLDAFLMTVLPLRQGTRLMVICLINVSVAMAIGLVIMNVWQPGLTWRSNVDALLDLAPASAGPGSTRQRFATNIGAGGSTDSRPPLRLDGLDYDITSGCRSHLHRAIRLNI